MVKGTLWRYPDLHQSTKMPKISEVEKLAVWVGDYFLMIYRSMTISCFAFVWKSNMWGIVRGKA